MQEKKQSFCSSDIEDSTVEFNKLDYMMLFRTLDSIRITAKEYLEDRLTKQEAYEKIKMEYEFYKCNTKRNIQENRNNKTFLMTIFGVLVYLVILFFNYMIIKQFYNLFGDSGEGSVSVIYGIIILMLINPIFSVMTVSYDFLMYTTSNSMNIKLKDDIKNLETHLESALLCSMDEFTHEKVCTFYKYFDDEKNDKKLCKCLTKSCKDSNENIMTDHLTTKMEKLDSVYQFFENQKGFVLKSKNPMLQIRSNEKLDHVLNFFMGEKVEETVRNNMRSYDRQKNLVGENSQEIRNNASAVLKHLESYMYYELGDVIDYETYFVKEMNELFTDLTKSVIYFLGNGNNKETYLLDNKLISKNNTILDEKILFRCDNYQDTQYKESFEVTVIEATKESIMEIMLKLQIRLRRLNKLWLPEYEVVRNFMYKSKDKEVDVNIQKALYRSANVKDMESLFNDIIAVVVNNPNLVELFTIYIPRELDGTNNIIQCSVNNIDSLEPYIEKLHVRHKSVNIREHMPGDILVKNTLMIPKINTFIKNLKYNFLDQNFKVNKKIEFSIIKNIIEFNLEDLLHHETKVVNYITHYVKDERRDLIFHEAKSEERAKRMEIILIKNLTIIFKEVFKTLEKETKNSELYFNAKNGIEFPNKYITFNEFDLKLQDFDRDQYGTYMDNVVKVKDDIVFFIDKIDTIDNNMEKQHQRTFFYSNYLVLYFIISFLIVFDIIFTEYYGISFDIFIVQYMKNFKQGGSLGNVKESVKQNISTFGDKLKKMGSYIKNKSKSAYSNVNSSTNAYANPVSGQVPEVPSNSVNAKAVVNSNDLQSHAIESFMPENVLGDVSNKVSELGYSFLPEIAKSNIADPLVAKEALSNIVKSKMAASRNAISGIAKSKLATANTALTNARNNLKNSKSIMKKSFKGLRSRRIRK